MSTEESIFPKPPTGTRFNLSDDIFLIIRKKIMTREIIPGERINIDSLSRDLNVSQTPIREALARLEETGLISKEPLKGFKASQLLTNKEAQELFSFRELVEPFAAHLTARIAKEEQVNLLVQELKKANEVSSKSGLEAFEALAEHDERFHAMIFDFSDNALLVKAYRSTHCFLHLYRLHFVRDVPVDFNDTMSEHLAIVEAIKKASADEARIAMVTHLENARSRFQYPAI
ncbi:MAG: GntR family transcriptional regulator [Candidatus Nanopelagicales bacterium]